MQHAANKAVETHLTKENLLGTSVLTGHFGAVRGRNDFERCLAALILGRNQPPIEAVEAIARAIYATDPRPLNLIKPDPPATD
jgi:hypothetical protein